MMDRNEHPLPKRHSMDTVKFSNAPSPLLTVMAEEFVGKVKGMIRVAALEDVRGVMETEFEPMVTV